MSLKAFLRNLATTSQGNFTKTRFFKKRLEMNQFTEKASSTVLTVTNTPIQCVHKYEINELSPSTRIF